MNKRLVWNFEINLDERLSLDGLASQEDDAVRWEARYFWPEKTIISLYGLDDKCLMLTPLYFQNKQRQDVYYLLPEYHLNIKIRREELVYKPLLSKKEGYYGFGKKINVMDLASEQALPGCPSLKISTLHELIKAHGKPIEVFKTALIHKFNTTPPLKLELSRLIINQVTYFSASIEGRSYSLVKQASEHLLKQNNSCDYVTFLHNLSHDK